MDFNRCRWGGKGGRDISYFLYYFICEKKWMPVKSEFHRSVMEISPAWNSFFTGIHFQGVGSDFTTACLTTTYKIIFLFFRKALLIVFFYFYKGGEGRPYKGYFGGIFPALSAPRFPACRFLFLFTGFIWLDKISYSLYIQGGKSSLGGYYFPW